MARKRSILRDPLDTLLKPISLEAANESITDPLTLTPEALAAMAEGTFDFGLKEIQETSCIKIGDTIRLENIHTLCKLFNITPKLAVDFCFNFRIPLFRLNSRTYYNLHTLETVLFYLLKPGNNHIVMAVTKSEPEQNLQACYKKMSMKTELIPPDLEHLANPSLMAEMTMANPKVRRKALFSATVREIQKANLDKLWKNSQHRVEHNQNNQRKARDARRERKHERLNPTELATTDEF